MDAEQKVIVSRRGVFYDLSLSPYETKSPYGDIFKFSSAKKKEIFDRDVIGEMLKVEKVLRRHGALYHLPPDVVEVVMRTVMRCFYESNER